MQRTLVKLFRFIPLPVFYGLTACVIPFYMLLDRRGYKASYRFFRQRLGRSAFRSFCNVYANEFRMGQVVMDRFALYADRRFELLSDDEALFSELETARPGFVQVSCHAGNYEMAGYSLKVEHKRMYVLVYDGETETVMRQRSALFSRSNIEMVPVSEDMSHLFILNSALLEGGIVSMPGDRIFGSQKSISCDFFGAPARFPAGPFLLAAQRSAPMLAVFVMKEGMRRYRIVMQRIDEGIDRSLPARRQAEQMAAAFAACTERVVRRWPTQWFNFYDFWK